MNFNGKVVLVTGASSGIGAAIAEQFAEHGAKVAIVARNEKKLKSVSEKLAKGCFKPLVIVADVTKDDDIKRIIKDTIQYFGKLDVLINNAGMVGSVKILDEHVIETFDQVMATNLRSAVLLTNLAAPHLVKSKGNIVNISSIAAICVLKLTNFAYDTSKAALDHFTRYIALELAPEGVRVNSVNPGPVKTDIFENAGLDQATAAKVWDAAKETTALGRISDPEEVADLVLFISSDKAKSITGASYVIDNGLILKR